MRNYIISSSKRETWTKFRKKPRSKKQEKGRYLFDESSRKELENKAYPSEFMAATTFFGSRSVDWMFGSLEVATTFLLFRWLVVPFLFSVLPEAFLVGFPRIQWAIFVVGTWGVPKLMFHWSAAWPSWQPLWWGVISFQNFRGLKLELYFCVDFLAIQIWRIIMKFGENVPCMVINAKKGLRHFWYSKYISFWRVSCDEDRQIFNSPTSK